MSRDEIAELVGRFEPRVRELRRQLHRRPELAFAEHATAALIAAELSDLAVDHQSGVAGTGVVARLDGDRPGPTLLLRADLDALPVQEADDGRAVRSEVPGVMHACGHDGHVAVLLGVLRVLATTSWPGRVIGVFQPAEETDEGAAAVIATGLTAGADAALGLHLDTTLPTGVVGVSAGVQWARCEQFQIEVGGEAGHAGFGTAVDAVAVAAECVLTIERLARDWPPGDHASVTVVRAAEAPNVTPERVTLQGTLRTLRPDSYAGQAAAVEQEFAAIGTRRGATIGVSWGPSCPALRCDPAISEEVRAAAAESTRVAEVRAGIPTTGCDDFARYLEAAPGCYFRVGAAPATGPVAHHHPRFDLAEESLSVAVEVLARSAFRVLNRRSG
ncbi:M20 family metallopeptidase [Microlunatus sp. GCM10028923]|uniref:M20 metallopeptidase family protein n=1 Tax=Microlunatus sp. GCM10028923 TaxID=3273400 RepID=UPI00361D1573